MNHFKLILLFVFIHGFGSCSMAQTVGKQIEANSMLGMDFKNNLVKNPSAYENINNITGNVGAVFARDTTAGNMIDGKASISFTLEPGEAINWDLNTPSSEQEGGNCEFKGLIKVPGSGVTLNVQITDGSNVSLTSALVPSTGSIYRTFSLDYPCGASGTRKVRLINNDGSLTTSGNIGGLYYGLATNIGLGVAQNEFAAKVSSTGVISDATGAVTIVGGAPTDTSLFSLTWTGLSAAPTCTVSIVDPAVTSAAPQVKISTAETSTGVTVRTYYTDTANNIAKAAYPFRIKCTKTGSDFVQNTITVNNLDFDWKDYVVAVVSDSGTFPTYTLTRMQYRRGDGKMYIRGGLTMTNANTWNGIRIPVPSGHSIDTSGTIPSSSIRFHDSGTGTFLGDVTSVASSYLFVSSFGGTNGANISVSQGSPFTWTTGDSIDWEIGPLSIVGWGISQGAPQLLGSVTSNSSSSERIERSTVSVTCSGSPCTQSTSSSNWATITRNSTGNYSVAYSNIWSIRPTCSIILGAASASIAMTPSYLSIPTTTGFQFISVTTANNLSDTVFDITCWGPR